MKSVLLFLLCFGLSAVQAFGQKKETRAVSGFTGIDASSAFDITVAKGGTESLVIEADDNIMALVRSEVRNGVLHLWLDNNRNVKNIKTLKASVVMKNLDRVTLSGACKFTSADLFTPDRFEGDCSGASNLTVNVNTGALSIKASGASKIRMQANVTGTAQLDVAGASNIQADLSADRVNFNSSGVSSLELKGSANDIKVDISGSSNIQAGNFSVKTATIESSGTGKVTIHASEALNVNSSGASTVEYKGSPAIRANTGGASKIRKI